MSWRPLGRPVLVQFLVLVLALVVSLVAKIPFFGPGIAIAYPPLLLLLITYPEPRQLLTPFWLGPSIGPCLRSPCLPSLPGLGRDRPARQPRGAGVLPVARSPSAAALPTSRWPRAHHGGSRPAPGSRGHSHASHSGASMQRRHPADTLPRPDGTDRQGSEPSRNPIRGFLRWSQHGLGPD